MPPQTKGKLAVVFNCINFYIYTHGAMWCFPLSHFNGLWFWAFYLHQNTLYDRILMVITWWNTETACRHLHQERHDKLTWARVRSKWVELIPCWLVDTVAEQWIPGSGNDTKMKVPSWLRGSFGWHCSCNKL